MDVPLTGISEEQRQQTAETAIKNTAVAEYQQNRECAEALKKLINDNFDGYHLNSDKVLSVAVNVFGEKRVELALASSINQMSYDGRLSKENRNWAYNVMIPQDEHNRSIRVDAHAALLDKLTSDFRKLQRTISEETSARQSAPPLTNADYIANKYGIADKIQKLEADLLKIPHVTKVDFDLDGFLDDINQVIFVLKYDIPADTENYFGERKNLISGALEVAAQNGLSRTGDAIEDYGEHFYFVTKCDDTWELNYEDEDCSPEM